MIQNILAKIVGTQNERDLKKLRPIVAEVNAFEPAIQALSDEQLRGKTAEFRTRLAAGETLDDLLPEAFAVVREAGRRVLNMRHFDVQLIGGAVLHKGKIYRFLGMTVGVIQHDLNDAERQVAYNADITYGTNNEFGFDYLRDNMKFDPQHFVQRELNYAIVDEVDSILIDE